MTYRKNCEFILLAEFDIDEGSVLRHEYPEPTGCDGHLLAELMLPDGAHLRTEDWTVFMLNQTPATTVASASMTDHDGSLLYTINLVRTKHGAAYKRGAAVKALAVCTPHPWIQVFKPLLLLSLDDFFNEPTVAVLKRLYECINAIDIASAPQLTINERLILRNSERKDLFEEKYQAAYDAHHPATGADTSTVDEHDDDTPIEEVTAHAGVQHRSRSTTPIQLKLARATPDQESVTDFGSMSLRSRVTSNASSGGLPFLPSSSIKMDRKGSTVSLTSSLYMRSLSRTPRDTHFFDTAVTYNDTISMPIRLPMSTFAAEVGDYSLITLIQTFSTYTSTVGPLHAHLHTNGNLTPPIIVLFNAMMTNKRILFLGGAHQPANQVANFVLAAAALGSGCGQFFGTSIIERCFPYSNLTNMENHMAVPGYIAGVSNPRFEDLTSTWDVLCNIETSRILISKDIAQPSANARDSVSSSHVPVHASSLSVSTTSAPTDSIGHGSPQEPQSAVSGFMPFGQQANGFHNSTGAGSTADSDFSKAASTHSSHASVKDKGDGKIESRLDFPDNVFMDDVTHTIQAHYGESAVRARFTEYVRKFLRLASRYEEEKSGFSSIDYPSKRFTPGNLGSGPTFSSMTPDELRRELNASMARIDGWRRTIAYDVHKAEWLARQQSESRHMRPDIQHQVSRLRLGKKLSSPEVEAILRTLNKHTSTDEEIVELLAMLPAQFGGLLPLSFGLFHPSTTARNDTVELLTTLNGHRTGTKFLQSLNSFHRLAYARLAAEKGSSDFYANGTDNNHPLPPVPVA